MGGSLFEHDAGLRYCASMTALGERTAIGKAHFVGYVGRAAAAAVKRRQKHEALPLLLLLFCCCSAAQSPSFTPGLYLVRVDPSSSQVRGQRLRDHSVPAPIIKAGYPQLYRSVSYVESGS